MQGTAPGAGRPLPTPYEDNAWFWVELPPGQGHAAGKVPAVFLAGTQTWHGFGFGGVRTKDLTVLKPLEQSPAVPASVHEALADAHSVINSINRGKGSAVELNGETCFAQRQEWTTWAVDEVLPKLAAALEFTKRNVCAGSH
ncbi:hypothetical protein [Comamonas thiooxydans]|uniref:hypothetical protein n=1 Tax=Comamonas thiooxydans TaxID=363952 RepID=UPI000B416FC1|nr:hypothetical protein [Comamonas thiooxydans]